VGDQIEASASVYVRVGLFQKKLDGAPMISGLGAARVCLA